MNDGPSQNLGRTAQLLAPLASHKRQQQELVITEWLLRVRARAGILQILTPHLNHLTLRSKH